MPTRWWDGEPKERFWLEITDRDDLGSDLNAPTLSEQGKPYWSYDFVREVREGNVVLHYQARPFRAITHWSRAIGEPYEDDVLWGAHGQAGGRGPVEPYWRPGWRRPLEGPYPLPSHVTDQQLRASEGRIRELHEELKSRHPDIPVFFPFQLSNRRPLRAFQGYLTKFPESLIELIPQLSEIGAIAQATSPRPERPAPTADDPDLGTDYRHAHPSAKSAKRQPFSVDPDLVDRALRAHARTQDALAQALRDSGHQPRSPAPGEPMFDIAWEVNDVIHVAEVKSLSGTNDEKQLRLALGQVLRYAHLLRRKNREVKCFIAAESRPQDESWIALCDELGVTLLWPESFAEATDSL